MGPGAADPAVVFCICVHLMKSTRDVTAVVLLGEAYAQDCIESVEPKQVDQ